MNMFDEACALDGMIRMRGMTQSHVAETLGVSQSYVANKLRLLRFSGRMRDKILSAGVSERHARTLLRLPEEGLQRIALSKISEGQMTVAQSEILVERMLDECGPERIREATDSERIGVFEDVLDASLTTLRHTGVLAKKSVERYNGKMYITIAIG